MGDLKSYNLKDPRIKVFAFLNYFTFGRQASKKTSPKHSSEGLLGLKSTPHSPKFAAPNLKGVNN